MSIETIIAQIDSEIARLTEARNLLAKAGTAAPTPSSAKTKAGRGRPRKRRVLSPEARKRIADAQRKRWAAQRAKTK
jgi:hypothetical protein